MANEYGLANRIGIAERRIGSRYQNYLEWGVSKHSNEKTIPTIWLQRTASGMLNQCQIEIYCPDASKIKEFGED